MTLGRIPFVIIGTGAVSRAFMNSFASAKVSVVAVTSRCQDRAKSFVTSFKEQMNPLPEPVQFQADAPSKYAPSHVVWGGLCAVLAAVPDYALNETLARGIATALPNAECVIHASGRVPSRVLRDAADKYLSLHPCAVFPKIAIEQVSLDRILVGVESDLPKLQQEGMELVRKVGGRPFLIESEGKSMYHTACSISSNFVWTLLNTSVELLHASGVDKAASQEIVIELARSAVESTGRVDCTKLGDALTGPIIRSDIDTIRSHMHAVSQFPRALDLYVTVGRSTAICAFSAGYLDKKRLSDILEVLRNTGNKHSS